MSASCTADMQALCVCSLIVYLHCLVDTVKFTPIWAMRKFSAFIPILSPRWPHTMLILCLELTKDNSCDRLATVF